MQLSYDRKGGGDKKNYSHFKQQVKLSKRFWKLEKRKREEN